MKLPPPTKEFVDELIARWESCYNDWTYDNVEIEKFVEDLLVESGLTMAAARRIINQVRGE